MQQRSEFYDTVLGTLSNEIQAAVRRETFGEDIGQMGWLTVDEYRTFFTWLQLHADQHVLDVGPPGANAGKFTVSRSSSTS